MFASFITQGCGSGCYGWTIILKKIRVEDPSQIYLYNRTFFLDIYLLKLERKNVSTKLIIKYWKKKVKVFFMRLILLVGLFIRIRLCVFIWTWPFVFIRIRLFVFIRIRLCLYSDPALCLYPDPALCLYPDPAHYFYPDPAPSIYATLSTSTYCINRNKTRKKILSALEHWQKQ